MFNKRNLILIISLVVVLCIIVIFYFSFYHDIDDNSIDKDIFINMAKNSQCSDINNRLFLIDDQIVFWRKEGSCSDASYSYTLFGSSPNDILCEKFDSIAGPQEKYYNENYKEIFYNIIENLDDKNLGLDANNKVTEIYF